MSGYRGKYEFVEAGLRSLAEDLDGETPDDEFGSVDDWGGNMRLIDKYILSTDQQGFVYLDEFDDADEARAEFDAQVQEVLARTEEDSKMTETRTVADDFIAGIRAGTITPKDIESALSAFVNGSRHSASDFSDAVANDHPTLVGQMAKAMAIGVMRRATYNPEWRPYDPLWTEDNRICDVDTKGEFPKHAFHDGRLDCATIIGASLMARQSYI